MSKSPEGFGPEFGTTVVTEEANSQLKVLAAVMAAEETATINAALETAKAETASLKADLERVQAALDVATAKAATAETELATFKADVDRQTEIAKLRGERAEAVKAVSPALLTGGDVEVAARVERWASMEAATFEAFVSDLKAIASPETSAGFSAGAAETATVTARTGVVDKPSASNAAKTLLGSN